MLDPEMRSSISFDDTHRPVSEYYWEGQFVNRSATDGSRTVDLVIPIIHTNEICARQSSVDLP